MRAPGVVLASFLLVAVPASAKEFPPGELRVCGATQCRVVTDAQSRAFSALLWGDGRVRRAPTPRVGSPIYQLRFENGPAGAIISAAAIRVRGLNCGRFERGKWVPAPRDAQRIDRRAEAEAPQSLRSAFLLAHP